MNPELAVIRASSANELVRIVQSRAACSGVVTAGEPFAVGVIHDQTLLVIPANNNDVARSGEHSVNDARVIAVDRLFDGVDRTLPGKVIFTAKRANDFSDILCGMAAKFAIVDVLEELIF